MAFCKNCGTRLNDGVKFCPNCGAAAAESESNTQNAQMENAQTNTQTNAQPNAQPNGWENFCSTENDITAEVDPADAKDNMVFGIFAYLFWLCLIPLLARKQSKFCQFHAKQGLFLAVIETAIIVVFGILGLIPYVGWLFGTVSYILNLACTFFSIVGIYNVVTGKTRELPIIGKFNFFK